MVKANSNPQTNVPTEIRSVALYTFWDQNSEIELRGLRQYAARRGWRVAGEYVDHGISVSKDIQRGQN